MGFVEDTFGKGAVSVSIADLEQLIVDKREEGQHLEYKDARILRNPEQLSSSISAFLNAEGGLLILGISEDDSSAPRSVEGRVFPKELGLAEPSFTRERVDQLIHSNIRADAGPSISVTAVRNAEGSSAFLLDIPQGDTPPYQAADGRYYRRLNSTKYPMRHYEISDFFGRRRHPDLYLVLGMDSFEERDGKLTFALRIFVENLGSASAKYSRYSMTLEGAESVEQSFELQRIDSLRTGRPSVQWSHDTGVIHPRGNLLSTGKLHVTMTSSLGLTLIWDIVADDMPIRRSKDELLMSQLLDLSLRTTRLRLTPATAS